MSQGGCKNGCTTPLSFPRRPGENLPTVHGEGCFCCSPNERISGNNRPALPHFNYRIGTYGSIREWLLNRINQTPNLQNWTHRAPDDPAIALLEGASILGDILTFYQETYANEAFLRTAQWRESISDLVRLLGYRLSPAVGGNATFAFEIKKDEPVVIPAGFPLKATLEEFPKPSDFETTEEITAYPWLSRFNLFRPLAEPDIMPTTSEFYITSPEQLTDPIDLKVGDRILVGEPAAFFVPGWGGSFSDAEIAIVDSIREQHDQKIYKIKGNLKRSSSIAGLYVYRLGRTFHHFGYNSPAKIVNTSAAVTSSATVTGTTTSTTSTIPYQNVPMSRPVDTANNFFSNATVSAGLSDVDFPIDSEVKDLPNNVPVIIQASYTYPLLAMIIGQPLPIQTTIRMIADVRTVTMTWGGVSGTVSQLRLNAELGSLGSSVETDASMQIADALFHEVTSPLFFIKAAKTEPTTPTKGNTLNFYGTAERVKTLDGRRIMLETPDGDPRIVTVTQVPATFDGATESFPVLRPITLSEEVTYADFPNETPVTTVFGNLADGDEGKTLPEVSLGSGDATQVFQNFKIPKAPLTYHIVPENTPPETPEAEIYVDGRMWIRVDSFFERGAEEQIYIVREDALGNSWAQFGDGKTGARLTNGVNNVTVIFRLGSGAYGPLKADTKVQASAKIKNLDKIGMPMVASGGSKPEDGENARNAAPGKVQSLGRIVSLKDFESEAAAIPGVASAAAAWQLVENVPAVVITVLMETGRSAEIAEVRETLSAYNTLRGAGRFSVQADLGKRKYVSFSVQYALKPGFRSDLVEPQIRLALGVNFGQATGDEDQTGLFSVRRRRFGGSEYASSIEGVTQNVEGVLWAKTIAFTNLTNEADTNYIDDPEKLALPSVTTLEAIVPCGAGFILSLYDKHLLLTVVAGEGS